MKSVIIYLILVGIPVAGVIGVLRVGRHITPPPYVGGTWAVTIHPDSLCGPSVPDDSLTMVVSQSGSHIGVSFQDSTLPRLKGRTYGRHFQVAAVAAPVRLHASVKRGENRMRGILVGTPCPSARKTLLRGTRVAAPGAVDPH